MSPKALSFWLATAGLFRMGIMSGNAADYGAGRTDASAEPKPPIVDWQSVESGDCRTYVSNLQAMGCPKRTIQSIVTTDVIAAFAGKRSAAVAARYQNFKQVEMTVSWTAENLRHAMVHFESTQGEFQAIFSAWQPHDARLAQIYAKRQADPGSGEVYVKIKGQLSAARYDQYCATWWK